MEELCYESVCFPLEMDGFSVLMSIIYYRNVDMFGEYQFEEQNINAFLVLETQF